MNALNFTMEAQEQDNWCWAATSVSIKRFYSPGNITQQCNVANKLLQRNDCCTMPSCSDCDKYGYLHDALKHLGNLRRWRATRTSFNDIKTEIDGKQPIGVAIKWDDGGAHFVAITGYNDVNEVLGIHDPDLGYSEVPFSVFRETYDGRGKWCNTIFTKP